MLRPNTLIVIGAAVSGELGFPLGGGLRGLIADVLKEGSRSAEMAEALSTNGGPDIWDGVRRLCSALPVHPSIDNLIEFHRADDSVVTAAKLGIAAAIINEEFRRRAGLVVEPGQPVAVPANNSLHDLFQLIIQGASRRDMADAISRVSFINFNYDRSLEQFLFRAMTDHLGLSLSNAEELLASIDISHPYGSLGSIIGERRVQFGQRPEQASLYEISQSIRTFSEEVDSVSGQMLRNTVRGAERIIFLGCAHHPQNMALLDPFGAPRAQAVYATLYRIPPEDLYIQPSMPDFLIPSILNFRRTIEGWAQHCTTETFHLGPDRIRAEALTSRQMIARYGAEWSDSRTGA